VQIIWWNLVAHFGYTHSSFPSIPEAFKGWSVMNKEWRAIPLLTIWAIWKWRNGMNFSTKRESHSSVIESILSLYNALLLSGENRIRNGRSLTTWVPSATPCAFFDEAAQHGLCACGVYIIPEDG